MSWLASRVIQLSGEQRRTHTRKLELICR